MSPLPVVTMAVIGFLLGVGSPVRADPEKLPPLVDLWSGKALNELLPDIAAAHAKNRRGPEVVLDPAILKQINLAPPDSGNFGLLCGDKQLTWPTALGGEKHLEARNKVEGLLLRAVRSLKQDPTKPVQKSVLADLEKGVKQLGDELAEEVGDLSPTEYIQARRHLNFIAAGVTALKNPSAGRFVDGTYAARGKSVAELADHLQRNGLRFVPAVPGQEAAYRTLYERLKAYHAGLSTTPKEKRDAEPRP
jgi:hypothetical protein